MNCMIHVALDANSRAVTISLLIKPAPGNLHFASTKPAQQHTNRLQIQMTTVMNTLLKMYLESGTQRLAATVNISEKLLVVGFRT